MITGLAGAPIWSEDLNHLLPFYTMDWKRLKDAGVEFVEDPTDYGNLTIATLKDPEGNLVQLFQSSGAA